MHKKAWLLSINTPVSRKHEPEKHNKNQTAWSLLELLAEFKKPVHRHQDTHTQMHTEVVKLKRTRIHIRGGKLDCTVVQGWTRSQKAEHRNLWMHQSPHLTRSQQFRESWCWESTWEAAANCNGQATRRSSSGSATINYTAFRREGFSLSLRSPTVKWEGCTRP